MIPGLSLSLQPWAEFSERLRRFHPNLTSQVQLKRQVQLTRQIQLTRQVQYVRSSER